MTILEVIEQRQNKYKKQAEPSQTIVSKHGYNSAWWALQDLKEIIEQNNIKEVGDIKRVVDTGTLIINEIKC